MEKKKKYNFVKRKIIESIQAQFIILLGQRSNGKSFSVKESVLIDAYKNGNEDCLQTGKYSKLVC